MTGYNFDEVDEPEELPGRPKQIRAIIRDTLEGDANVRTDYLAQQVGKQVELSQSSVKTLTSELLNWMEQQEEVECRQVDSQMPVEIKKKLWTLIN